MKKILLLLFLIFYLTSCTTVKYITIPLTAPPEPYTIKEGSINTQKELFKEYQKTLIKLNEWQKWYNIQAASNYFRFDD